MMYTVDIVRYHDIHTKFHGNWFRHSKVNGRGITDSTERA
jgi:hypothetical protein